MTISVEEKRLIDQAEAHKDFVVGEDGSYVYWPDNCPGGALSSWMLRALADELDRRNAQWERQQGITP